MNYIVYDLEATCWDGIPTMTQETIEIGAVMVNRYGEITGKFNKFIQPVLHPNLSTFCSELTSIRQEDLRHADKFEIVIRQFMEWGRIEEEEYLLCSWGNFDKRMLFNDCLLHGIIPDWTETHINLRAAYKEMKHFRYPPGLRKTIKKEGFEFDGTQHRALVDAENLAKVFIKYVDEWEQFVQ